MGVGQVDTFDVIVIGGGSGGSAAAGRLAEDGSRKVCLIEAGGRNDDFRVKTPGFLPFIPEASNYRYETVPQKGLNGRIGYQPRGRGLGGSSAINAMIYIRGHQFDYDQWAELGAHGWSYADVLPYFKRSEGNERGGDAWHGADGPLNVMDQRWPNAGSRAFVEAASRLQLPVTDDFNKPDNTGFGVFQVTQKAGERWSAARAYVEPLRGRANFDIRTDALVEKVIVENGRAVGVKIRRHGRSEEVRASGGVVLSAGAFNSPQILMLSGIGPAAHLTEMGIEVVADRKAVGDDLQDHIDYVASYQTESTDFSAAAWAAHSAWPRRCFSIA
jgi:choline dehydrogenase-like flavoprotein